MKTLTLCLAALALTSVSASRDPEPHPLAWLEGHWVGEGFGGIVEEVWLPERGGAMLGMFRLVVEDEVKIYELVTIEPDGDGFTMKLKHFNSDLSGWEAQHASLVWPSDVIEDGIARFGPVLYARRGEDELSATVEVEQGGESRAEELVFRRAGG